MGTCPTRCHSNRTILENSPEPQSPAFQESITVSLLDYPSFGQSELTMNIGDRLTVTSDDGDFMMVKSACTDRESYVPTNYTAMVTQRWLYTGISRFKAVELLMLPQNVNGSFLIRESETNKGTGSTFYLHFYGKMYCRKCSCEGVEVPLHCYSLSVLRKGPSSNMDSVKHYRISHLPNRWVYISPRLTFPSLQDLIQHYTERADGLCCQLTKPCFIRGMDGVRPVVIRRATMNWKDISRSVIFRGKRTESGNSFVSEGLREAISSYLQMTEGSDLSGDT